MRYAADINFVVCEATGKRGYTSKRRALAASSKNGLRLRVYLCLECKRYHVTKRSGA